jgi:(p)ppGpp synthase/HD superfamily hydrolase
VVEILTAAEPDAGPAEAWLDAARTGHARVHIARWIAERSSETAGAAGRKIVAELLAERELDLLDLEGDGTMLQIAAVLGYPNLDRLYGAVAANAVTVDQITDRLPAAD